MRDSVVAVVGEECEETVNLLQSEGLRVVTIPMDSVEDIPDLMPDLILLPLWRDPSSAHKACRYFKRNSRTRPIPVVYVTSREKRLEEGTAFISGCIDYITSFNKESLSKLLSYIKLGRLEKAANRILHKLEIA